jgi:hypothetical protein
MTVQIEQGRLNIQKLREEIRLENRKFIFQAIGSLAAAMAAPACCYGAVGPDQPEGGVCGMPDCTRLASPPRQWTSETGDDRLSL